MKILALDSTALTATVALCEDEHLIGLYTLNSGSTQSETLLPMVESLMHMIKWDISDIDLFACAKGPGSFTGVRIGAATIKGLAFGSDKPCLGISTLEALAHQLVGLGNGAEAIFCPVMNARRGQVYNALFRVCNGKLTRLCDDRALSIAFQNHTRYSDRQLEDIISLLTELDGQLKRGGADRTILMEQGMVKLALLVAGRRTA